MTAMDLNAMPGVIPPPEFPQMPPENISTQQLYMLMLSMHAQQSVVVGAVNDAKREIQTLKAEQADMVETWKTAKGVLRFIKLLGVLGGSILAIFGVAKLT